MAATDDDEQERLRTLQSFEVLDTEEEQAFDDFTFLVSTFLDVPIALISLVDEKRQWFKSYLGLDVRETSRDVAFCDTAIRGDDVMIVQDAHNDERFRSNPLVLGDPSIRFYAGAPLISTEGHALGTLCAIDTKPRQLDEHQQRVLSTLARQVMNQLELRRVTNRNLREKVQRLELEQKLQAQQRIDSLAVLAGGVAHDFNNLLVSILGNAGLARIELSPESPAYEIIEKIETAAQNAGELTKQLMAYSGEQTLGDHPVLNMSSLVSEISHLLDVVISRKVVLNIDVETQGVEFRGDPVQMRQVIMNLLMNASEAIGSRSGSVTIRTGFQRATREYLEQSRFMGSVMEGEFVFVEVSDTGEGMTSEVQRRMFDPFYTTKARGKGLGLAAVLGVVAAHGGAIQVYSEPHRGTTIRVLIPACDQLGEEPADQKVLRGNGEIVLVADDEEHVRCVTTAILEAAGFRTIEARDGQDAIDQYKANPDVAVAVLDLTMPNINGIDALRAILKQDAQARVVLMSGHIEQQVSKTLPGYSVAGFLQKPFTSEVLVQKVATVLAKRADGE